MSEFVKRGNLKHGHRRREKRTSEYAAWDHMKQRCLNPNHPRYGDYGGRGIGVCQRWMKFENFLADMGLKPSSGLTLERINNERGYYPINCKWGTWDEQRINTRRNTIRYPKYKKAA